MTTTVENPSPTPVAIGAPRGGPDQPTLRKDSWWVEPVVTVTVLIAFVVYSTWAAFVGKNYYAGADLHRDLISPFYSPCIANSCVPGSHTFGDAAVLELLAGAAHPDLPARLPPHLLLLPQGLLPVLLVVAARLRGGRRPPQLQRRDPVPADPPERPPLLLLDPPPLQLHPDLRRHHGLPPARASGIGISVGTVVLCVNAVFLWLYSPVVPRLPALLRRPGAAPSPSIRPATSSGSSSPRSTPTTCSFAWISLFGVALCDLYVRLVASGTIHDPGFHF